MINRTNLIDLTPGRISNICEIKVLICASLKEFNSIISDRQLSEAFQIAEITNYFNYCCAFKELVYQKLISQKLDSKNKKTLLNLTSIGEETVKIFKNNISKAILERLIATIEKILKEEKQNKNRKIVMQRKQDGYIVKLVLEETGSNLLDLEIFCPTQDSAESMIKAMDISTTEIYRCILAILSNDFETINEVANIIKIKKTCSQQNNSNKN